MSLALKQVTAAMNSRSGGSSGICTEGAVVFGICCALGVIGTAVMKTPIPAVAGLVVGFYLLLAIKVAKQWQKAAVLRLGRYTGLRGPGLFFVIPVIDKVGMMVDQRIRVTSASAESAMTRDTVPVSVDAIIFWVVWDAEKSVLEVQDFEDAVGMSAGGAAGIDRAA